MTVEPTVPTCRTSIPADAVIAWITPFDAKDRGKLRAWCDAVGPVALQDLQRPPAEGPRPIIVVSWNMGVGTGNLDAMWKTVVSPRLETGADVILLIQEAYRKGHAPAACPARSGVTARLGGKRSATNPDPLTFASDRHLYAVYAPSMRNGRRCDEEPREDRGNAIVSTLPLSEIAVVELPFAQERRAAVAATVRTSTGGVRVMSVHLDTLFGHRRQAEGIAEAVKILGWTHDVVIAGDFNAWWLDSRVRLKDYGFAEVDCTRQPTRSTGRLDRIFRRDGDAPLACAPGPDAFGSDHLPLVAEIPSTPHGE